jgi:hypothetical protein
MEPLDEETKQWLAEKARASEAKRAEDLENSRALTAANKWARVRQVLGAMKPSSSSRERNWVSIFVASEVESAVSSATVEGVVFDVYGVMCGHMDGRDDFDAFDIITAEEEFSSWRLNELPIDCGSRVRIKFIDKNNYKNKYAFCDDHMDDVVLEVWIDQEETTT